MGEPFVVEKAIRPVDGRVIWLVLDDDLDPVDQGIYYERPEQVTDFRRVFERLQVQAEKPAKSPALISKAKDTL